MTSVQQMYMEMCFGIHEVPLSRDGRCPGGCPQEPDALPNDDVVIEKQWYVSFL